MPLLFLLDEFVKVFCPRLSPTPMNAGYADPEMHSSSTVISFFLGETQILVRASHRCLLFARRVRNNSFESIFTGRFAREETTRERVMREEEATQERRRKTTTTSVEKKHERIISRGEESESDDDDSEDDDFDGKDDNEEEEKDEKALNATNNERKMVKNNNDEDTPVYSADAAAAAHATTTNETTVEKNETNGDDDDAKTNETTKRRRLRTLRNDAYARKKERRQNRFGVPATALVTSVVHKLREASRALIDHLSKGRDEAERIFEKIGSSAEETKCAAHEIENASKEIDDLLRTLVDAGVRPAKEEKKKEKKNVVRGGSA
jgi:hypothetical protein